MFEQLTENLFVFPCDGYTDRPNIGLIVGKKLPCSLTAAIPPHMLRL